MRELLIKILEFFGLACWIEINTDNPRCTYYFGPFLNTPEALLAKDGYIEDLNNEGTIGIYAKIKRCKPNELTIFNEVEDCFELKNFFLISHKASLNV